MEHIPLPYQPESKSKSAMRAMAMRGQLPGCAPVGYLNVTEGYKKKVIVDEVNARLVRLAFMTVATEEKPLRSVLQEMAVFGLCSRNGKTMGVSSFWGMLTNPFYMGLIRYKGEVVRGCHPAIVDKRLFSLVQLRLRERNRSRRSVSSMPSPVSGSKKQAG